MNWFIKDAPVRAKLLVAFAVMTILTAIAALVPALTGAAALPIGIAMTVCAAILGLFFRRVISLPYVGTVVRMEGLAAGDLRSPIAFSDYRDCVGRMTKAMDKFRNDAIMIEEAAAAKRESERQQQQVVETVSSSLALLADGNLTATIDSQFPRDFEELKTNVNTALAKLRDLIGGVTHSAQGIRTGSSEIAQASEDLARRTEGNAASLEETSAALVQIDNRLKATAASSTQTVTRADQAIATVDGGRATADEAVQAMGRVSESAKGIDSVIEGLDKIAFQTRVLAMNAAVEAGRAGDAGRGFAVVADLVSALAMRAEEEAKRARDQLTLTQTDIVAAVQAVRKVDGALINISGDVGEVHSLLGTMADDAAAQSTAITQISAAISAMDQSTQQNAAMVEQTSAAARNLTTEVNALADQTATFTIDTRGAMRSPTSVARPAPARQAAPATYRSPVAALAPPAPMSAPVPVGAGGDDWNAF